VAEQTSVDALEATIVQLAKKAEDAASGYAEQYAAAARHLAEARAWLKNPAQPH